MLLVHTGAILNSVRYRSAVLRQGKVHAAALVRGSEHIAYCAGRSMADCPNQQRPNEWIRHRSFSAASAFYRRGTGSNAVVDSRCCDTVCTYVDPTASCAVLSCISCFATGATTSTVWATQRFLPRWAPRQTAETGLGGVLDLEHSNLQSQH